MPPKGGGAAEVCPYRSRFDKLPGSLRQSLSRSRAPAPAPSFPRGVSDRKGRTSRSGGAGLGHKVMSDPCDAQTMKRIEQLSTLHRPRRMEARRGPPRGDRVASRACSRRRPPPAPPRPPHPARSLEPSPQSPLPAYPTLPREGPRRGLPAWSLQRAGQHITPSSRGDFRSALPGVQSVHPQKRINARMERSGPVMTTGYFARSCGRRKSRNAIARSSELPPSRREEGLGAVIDRPRAVHVRRDSVASGMSGPLSRKRRLETGEPPPVPAVAAVSRCCSLPPMLLHATRDRRPIPPALPGRASPLPPSLARPGHRSLQRGLLGHQSRPDPTPPFPQPDRLVFATETAGADRSLNARLRPRPGRPPGPGHRFQCSLDSAPPSATGRDPRAPARRGQERASSPRCARPSAQPRLRRRDDDARERRA
jgi:hypothetical protein